MMPEYDGEYFLSEQSMDEEIADLPVLLHTVLSEEQTSEALDRYSSLKAFVKKLVPPVDLVEILKHFLELRTGRGLES